jgi:hypothetical protein
LEATNIKEHSVAGSVININNHNRTGTNMTNYLSTAIHVLIAEQQRQARDFPDDMDGDAFVEAMGRFIDEQQKLVAYLEEIIKVKAIMCSVHGRVGKKSAL